MVAFAMAAGCSGAKKTDLELPGPAPTGTSGVDGGIGTTPVGDGATGLLESGLPQGPACSQGTPEKEPNDTRAEANPIADTVCGAIQPGSDADVYAFTLDQDSLSLSFTGNVIVQVEVNGVSVALTPTTHPPIAIKKHAAYALTVRSLDGSPQPYTLTRTSK